MINNELIKKYKGVVWGLSSFIPKEADINRLFEIFSINNISDEEKEILLDTVNVFNLFTWSSTDEGFDFWVEIDKKQAKYMNSFYLDEYIYKTPFNCR